MPKIIINADDFGLDASVNRGIIGSFEKGYISSTTIMANMPGFDEACRMAHAHGVTDRIGMHFNLTQGSALTAPIRQKRRFCDGDGHFVFSKRRGIWLSGSEQAALAAELTAQWNKCLDAGIEPSHLDSHHHIQSAWGIAQVIIGLSEKLGIKAVRKNWNTVPKDSFGRRVYHRFLEATYSRANLDATPYATLPKHASQAIRNGMTPLEIMVHPTLMDGTIVDAMELRPMIEIFAEFDFSGRLCSYRDLLEYRNQQ